MEQGPSERMVIKQSFKRRIPLPESIQNAPRLRQGLEGYWEAFGKLTTTRAVTGMGPPGRIPWTAIDSYALRHGIMGDRFLDLEQIITYVDTQYVEYMGRKYKEENGG